MIVTHPLSTLSRTDLAVVGGKAANLGELTRLGLDVPDGFVVTTAAYAEQMRVWGLAERLAPLLAVGDWEATAAEASALCQRGELLPEIDRAVREAHRALAAPAVAVRSSATAEDLADASFAGQHETFLDVAGEAAVLLAIRGCWASLWSPRALGYRAARGVDHLGIDIAVVVQRMVPAEFAGVLFTVDPVAQRADRMLLEVAPGLGEAVVSGHTTGDVYRLRRPPFVSAASPEPADVAIEDRDRRDPERPAPNDTLVLELGRLALAIEAHFGTPQDVEFALVGGRIHILQSRPITTLVDAEIEPLPELPELRGLQRRMAEANDAGRFPVAPRPLDQWGFRVVIPALAQTLRFIGMAVDPADERATVDVLWRERMIPPKARPTLRLLRLPGKLAAALRRDWLAWWERDIFPEITEVCAPVDLRALDDAALLRHADRIATTYTEVLRRRFEGIIGQMAALLLRVPVRLAVGKQRAPAVLGDLVSGLHTRTSEVNAALYQLARRAASAGPEVTTAIREDRLDALGDSQAGRTFLAEVDAFLAAHGHRETTGFYLSAPTWQTDPAPMWGLLRGLLDASEPPSEAAGVRRYQAALAEVTGKLRRVPGLARAFTRLVEALRRSTVYRERSHYDLTRFFSALQAVIGEAARRLHERGDLPAPADVFYLTEGELRTWLEGQVPARAEVERLLRRRRATYGVVNGRWQKWAFRPGAADGSANLLRGIGASSGVVRGKARII
ncbi:MAG TPA: PEP/pyruvate-binding domain-containing protein, partial [Nannocystis sp.]